MSLEVSLNPIAVKLNWSDRVRGLFAVIIAYVALHSLSLARICQILRVAKRYCFREIELDEADIAWGAVRKTSFFFFGRVACLEASLAFVIFALTQGLSVEWCVGVAHEPFQAHAWVEVKGQPFREGDYVERRFKKSLSV